MSYIKNKTIYTQTEKQNIKTNVENNILNTTKKSVKKEFDAFFFDFENFNIKKLK